MSTHLRYLAEFERDDTDLKLCGLEPLTVLEEQDEQRWLNERRHHHDFPDLPWGDAQGNHAPAWMTSPAPSHGRPSGPVPHPSCRAGTDGRHPTSKD